MGALYSYFYPPPAPTEHPIKNPCIRLLNPIKNNFRGLIGTIIPIAIISYLFKIRKNDRSVLIVHLMMFWSILIQPVNVPVTGLVPIFTFPLMGVMNSGDVCTCYYNGGIALFILGGWIVMLLNNSGLDRRIILCCLYSNNKPVVTPTALLFRASFAAFLTSMLSNRLIATSEIMQYVTMPLLSSKDPKDSSKGKQLIDSQTRYILANAITTASTAGSLTILHSSYTALTFRTIVDLRGGSDIFNYFNYSLMAMPIGIVLFLVNTIYYFILLKVTKGELGVISSMLLKKTFETAKSQLPKKFSCHEMLSMIFLVLVLAAYFSRWTRFFGWSLYFGKDADAKSTLIKDATVSAIFAIFLHIFPKSFGFFKYLKSGIKKSELPNKPESTVLFWKFVDKNTNYGYIFLIGAGVALDKGIVTSGLGAEYSKMAKVITKLDPRLTLLIICFASVFLANIMTSIGALIMFLPFVMNIGAGNEDWIKYSNLAILAVGMGTSLGFACPFLYTPSYFVAHYAKVPLTQQIKYGVVSCVISAVVLWVMILFYANLILTKVLATTT